MTRTLLLVLALSGVAVAQPPGKGGTKKSPNPPPAQAPAGKKPEASIGPDFKAGGLTKLAVIVSGGGSKIHSSLGGGAGNSFDPARLVEDAFLLKLLEKGYTLAARSDVDKVLKEKNFQESGATEAAGSVGKILNVPAVMLVRVTDLSVEAGRAGQPATGRASVGARLIDVKTGAILWSGTHTDGGPLSGPGAVGQGLRAVALALADAFPEMPAASRAAPKPINPAAVPKLAVLTVGGPTRPGGSGARKESDQSDRDRQVEDAVVQVLLQKGYSLVSRTDMASLLKEQMFQQSGLTEDNAVAAGKLLNVSAVLVVSVTDYGGDTGGGPRGGAGAARAAVGGRLVDVASGEVRWVVAPYQVRPATGKGGKGGQADLLADVAKELANAFPGKP